MWGAIYPGQGSQHPGMGLFLFREFAEVRATFEEASDTLHVDFQRLCFEGSDSDLALTENTQPALLLVSTATDRVIKNELGFEAKAVAGHSIGEYAALVSAGALPFDQALRAVRQRGQAMQAAVPIGVGGMTAVLGASDEQVRALCLWAQEKSGDGPIEPANFNAPGQVVISGKKSALDWLAANFTADAVPGLTRAKFIPLKVSAPFHCSLMKPAEDVMKGVLEATDFSDAQIPVIQNVHARAEKSGTNLRQNLIKQVSAAVRWSESVLQIKNLGVTRLVEVGCGKVLAGLVKKIDSESLTTFNLTSLEEFKQLAAMINAGDKQKG